MERHARRKKGDFDYLVDVIDWELNVDPNFAQNLHAAQTGPPRQEMAAEGYQENWICYKSTAFSAKELTVFPGKSAVIKDAGAYGLIVLQGHGTMGAWDIESALIRYGQLTTMSTSFRRAPRRRAFASPTRASPTRSSCSNTSGPTIPIW